MKQRREEVEKELKQLQNEARNMTQVAAGLTALRRELQKTQSSGNIESEQLLVYPSKVVISDYGCSGMRERYYDVPIDAIKAEIESVCNQSKEWASQNINGS